MHACYIAHVNEFRALLTERLRPRGALARLARESDIKSPVIGHWQRGETRPSPANLGKIAGPLGVPYEDLLRMCGYLPGDAAVSDVDPELKARLARMGTRLTRYPRTVWLAVLEANEAMAQALEQSTKPPPAGDPERFGRPKIDTLYQTSGSHKGSRSVAAQRLAFGFQPA